VSQAGVVPTNKFDIAAAERAVALGWPGVKPVISELLEWIQDYNWPVAHMLAPFLAAVGRPLAPCLRPIFAGDDEVWKYWVIDAVLAHAPDELVEEFTQLLVRIAGSPDAWRADRGAGPGGGGCARTRPGLKPSHRRTSAHAAMRNVSRRIPRAELAY
jgi:hypothetical protein